jgi:N-acetylglutamate synthase-like GNAT family acetyltransferase
VQIRIAGTGDADAITNVINVAFRRAENFFIERNRIEPDKVREFLGTGEFLLANDDDSVVGCVYIEPRGDRAYLGLLAVDPSRQASGLGSRLMTAAEDRCRELGCKFVDLQIVNLRRELPEFYHRRGYAETGTAPFTSGIPTKLPCHFIKMTKPLGGQEH